MPPKKRPGLVRRLTTKVFGRRKKPVTPAWPGGGGGAPANLLDGKKLSERMWVPGLAVETVDVTSAEFDAIRTKASSSFGGECTLHVASCNTTSGSGAATLVGLARDGVLLLGVYELSAELDGVLFKRVCDRPARDLLKAGVLPGDWPVKYEPPNAYGGARKLPSRTSVKDIMSSS